jgi:hypothetical protein
MTTVFVEQSQGFNGQLTVTETLQLWLPADHSNVVLFMGFHV